MEIESEKIDSFYESIVSGKILRLSIFLTPCHETEENASQEKQNSSKYHGYYYLQTMTWNFDEFYKIENRVGKLVKMSWIIFFTNYERNF